MNEKLPERGLERREDSSHSIGDSSRINNGLEIRDYGRRGSAALTMRHPTIRKSWHYLRRQAAVARSV
jgi:hypothetical protein